jgi:hypothetical protein
MTPAPDRDAFGPGHELGGNRMRFSSLADIEQDLSWKQNLTVPERAVYWLLGWPWAIRHGRLSTPV